MNCVQYSTVFFILCLFLIYFHNGKNYAYANDNLIPAVPFFPERYIYLQKPHNKFHTDINNYILKDLKIDGLKFLVGQVSNKSDYNLILNYAVGCPRLGYSKSCRLLVLWDLFRGDNAPVTSWQAYYPVNIPIKKQRNRFKNFSINSKIIALIADDFIKSLNYETLKKQDFDKVYVKPDHLNDNTTLCSFDTIRHFYENTGLYVTDKAYKARFLITTRVTPLDNKQESKGKITIEIKRMILDRLTGHHSIFPLISSIEKDFLANDSYDCLQSANITIQNIGQFIDKAP